METIKSIIMVSALLLCIGMITMPQYGFAFERSALWKLSEKYHEVAARARKEGDFERAEKYEKRTEKYAGYARKRDKFSKRLEERERRSRHSEREDDSEYYEDAPKKVYTFSRPTPAPQRHRETQWFRAR
ncbi:MAG: hypothetical protein R8M38_00260 [Mariprofundaceae bacterium]